jgi:hypothetical protein
MNDEYRYAVIFTIHHSAFNIRHCPYVFRHTA